MKVGGDFVKTESQATVGDTKNNVTHYKINPRSSFFFAFDGGVHYIFLCIMCTNKSV